MVILSNIKIGDIINQYNKVISILGGEGKSGMGIVYICYNSLWDIPVALKTFQERFIFTQKIREEFKHEALAWVNLKQHPFIVKAYTVDNFKNRLFILLEYIPVDEKRRNTLAHYLKYPISLKEALNWGIQFCLGMEYALLHGIKSHRDIKPDNIMISPDQILKITDFGLAKLYDDFSLSVSEDELSSDNLNKFSCFKNAKECLIAGTPPWMAPEQFEGLSDVRSDIYSFGIVLFQMVNHGKLPFICKNFEDFSNAHKKHPTPKFESPLSSIIKRCLLKQPKDRYQDFEELRLDLEDLYKEYIKEELPSLPKEKLDDVANHLFRGYSFNQLGLYDKAQKELEIALKLDCNHQAIYSNLGDTYNHKGLYEKAIEILNSGINKFPNHWPLYIYLAKAYNAKGLKNKAQEAIEKAIKVDSNDALIYGWVGIIYGELGNIDMAIKSLQKSLELDPNNTNNAETYMYLGGFMLNISEPEALRMFQKSIELNPALDISYYYLGMSLYDQDKFNEALIMAQKAVALYPNKASYHVLLGAIFQELGVNNSAIKEYREALRIDPYNNDAQVNLNYLIKLKK